VTQTSRLVAGALRGHWERMRSAAEVPPGEGDGARREGRPEVGAAHSTHEAGEPAPRDPVEGRSGQAMAPLEGTMTETQCSGLISPKLQRVAVRVWAGTSGAIARLVV